jgi:hypothetical protein
LRLSFIQLENSIEELLSVMPFNVQNQFAKYRKMLSILPIEAVRQRMTVDGFSIEQINRFCEGDDSSSNCESQSENRLLHDQKKISKLIQHFPESAVRQILQIHGYSENEIVDLLSTFHQNVKTFQKYLRMQKVHCPAIIRQAMKADGFTNDQIENFLQGKLCKSMFPSSSIPVMSAAAEKQITKMMTVLPHRAVLQSLQVVYGFTAVQAEEYMIQVNKKIIQESRQQQDVKLHSLSPASSSIRKYFRMLMHLPLVTVCQRMRVDGLSLQDMESVLCTHGLTDLEVQQLLNVQGYFNPSIASAEKIEKSNILHCLLRYGKMLEMFPIEIVHQRMQVDVVLIGNGQRKWTEEEMQLILAAFSYDLLSPSHTLSWKTHNANIDRYLQMRHIGLSDVVLNQRMKMDGYLDHGKRQLFLEFGFIPDPPTIQMSTDEQKLNRYAEMFKVHPSEVVLQAMAREEATVEIFAHVLWVRSSSEPSVTVSTSTATAGYFHQA